MVKKLFCCFSFLSLLFFPSCSTSNNASNISIELDSLSNTSECSSSNNSNDVSADIHIGDNGNWWIDERDTGIASKTIVEPVEGENGNWWIDGVDTGIPLTIKIEPIIGDNGNWWIDGVDTEIPSKYVEDGIIYQTHIDSVLNYLKDDYANIAEYADGTEELSKPKKMQLSCNPYQDADTYVLFLSENNDYFDAESYSSPINSFEIENLKIHTRYFYKICAIDGDEIHIMKSGVFKTDSYCPRMINCDGVTNMRDLGGYYTDDGIIKQGLLYRTGRLNVSDSVEIKNNITDSGKKTMEKLHIKSEIDLRRTDNNEVGGLTDSSVLGNDVNYYQCPMEWIGGIYNNPNNPASVRSVFEYLSDIDNYPVIFHCNIGTDRTGFIAYLVNGLLGVKENDLKRDYLMSNFGKINSSRAISGMNEYVNPISLFPGNSTSERIENYLLSIGVTAQEISNIKNIMIDPYSFNVVESEATCQHGTIIYRECIENDDLSVVEELNDIAPHQWYYIAKDGSEYVKECQVCDAIEHIAIEDSGVPQGDFLSYPIFNQSYSDAWSLFSNPEQNSFVDGTFTLSHNIWNDYLVLKECDGRRGTNSNYTTASQAIKHMGDSGYNTVIFTVKVTSGTARIYAPSSDNHQTYLGVSTTKMIVEDEETYTYINLYDSFGNKLTTSSTLTGGTEYTVVIDYNSENIGWGEIAIKGSNTVVSLSDVYICVSQA